MYKSNQDYVHIFIINNHRESTLKTVSYDLNTKLCNNINKIVNFLHNKI